MFNPRLVRLESIINLACFRCAAKHQGSPQQHGWVEDELHDEKKANLHAKATISYVCVAMISYVCVASDFDFCSFPSTERSYIA